VVTDPPEVRFEKTCEFRVAVSDENCANGALLSGPAPFTNGMSPLEYAVSRTVTPAGDTPARVAASFDSSVGHQHDHRRADLDCSLH
jgi:hypothetical protein